MIRTCSCHDGLCDHFGWLGEVWNKLTERQLRTRVICPSQKSTTSKVVSHGCYRYQPNHKSQTCVETKLHLMDENNAPSLNGSRYEKRCPKGCQGGWVPICDRWNNWYSWQTVCSYKGCANKNSHSHEMSSSVVGCWVLCHCVAGWLVMIWATTNLTVLNLTLCASKYLYLPGSTPQVFWTIFLHL